MASRVLKFSVLVQKYRTPLLLAGCSGVFAAKLFYHVFPDATYRNLYQAWSRGEPAALSEKLEAAFQQVLKDAAVGSARRYVAFAAYGFHPVGAGIPWLPSGARIGIPSNFNSTRDDLSGITDRSILVGGKEVDWGSETGSALRNALVLSDDAQKFALAREVSRLQSAGPVLNAAVAPTCLAGSWLYAVALKQIFGLFARSVLLRAAVNALALGLGAVSYVFASDAVNQWLEFHSDRRAASLSPAYATGGLEFYEKILLRNQTLRFLMGPKGAEMYTPSGNPFPAGLMGMKHAAYTARRQRILALLRDQEA